MKNMTNAIITTTTTIVTTIAATLLLDSWCFFWLAKLELEVLEVDALGGRIGTKCCGTLVSGKRAGKIEKLYLS
jgi:hypothetical protein